MATTVDSSGLVQNMEQFEMAKQTEEEEEEGSAEITRPIDYGTVIDESSHTKQPINQGINWMLGSLILINSLVGAGILNLPYSVHAAGGILSALCIQMVMICLLWASITGVVWCSYLRGTKLYQDTVRAYLGPIGQYICSAIILCECFLITTTYIVAIGQQMSAGAGIVYPNLISHPLLSREFLVMAVSLLIILPFCLVKHIGRLHFASGLAGGAILIVAGVVVFEYHEIDRSNVTVRTSPTRFSSVFLSIPTYCFAYMFDLPSIAVYGRLQPRTVRTFMKASFLALAAVFCFYNIFAYHVYYTFGDKIKPNFMTNYHEGTWIVAAAQFGYSVKLCLEYPIFQYLGWTALGTIMRGVCSEEYCSYYLSEEKRPNGVDRFRLITSLLWIFSTMGLAFFAPSIDYIIPLTSVCLLQFQFIFPGILLLSAVRSFEHSMNLRHTRALRSFAIFLLIFGSCMTAIFLYQYVNDTILKNNINID